MLACAGALAQPKSDWEVAQEERNINEDAFTLPPLPKAEDLVEFKVSEANTFRFFLDGRHLSTGKDGIVRYTLVARSTSGAESVSFEGMRCKSGTYKVYAYARLKEGVWSPNRSAEWQEVQPKRVNRQHQALRREYLCPQGVPVADRAEAVDALRRGGHPNAGDLSRSQTTAR